MNSVTPVMRRAGIRKVWLNVHLYLALSVGIVIALLALTGIALAMKGAMLRWEVGAQAFVLPPPPDATWTPVSEWIERSKRAYPQVAQVLMVAAPHASPVPADTAVLTVFSSAGTIEFVTVNPYTAEPLQIFSYDDTFFFTVLNLHRSLLLPESIGANALAACGLVLLMSLGTGLYLWWPRNGAWAAGFMIQRGGAVLFLRSLHAAIAGWAFIVLLLLALTGIAIAKPDWAEAMIRPFSPVRVTDPMSNHEMSAGQHVESAECAEPTSIDAAVTLATSAVQGTQFASMTLAGDMPYAIRLKRADDVAEYGDTEVSVDRRCPRVLHVLDSRQSSAGDILVKSIRPLHGELLLRGAGRFVVLLAGAALLGLYLSGILLWLRRRRRAATASALA